MLYYNRSGIAEAGSSPRKEWCYEQTRLTRPFDLLSNRVVTDVSFKDKRKLSRPQLKVDGLTLSNLTL